MHQISLDDIKLANQIARLGSFTAAATHLGLPRPNVTRRIKQLEDYLGVTIFKRSTRRMSLTPEGAMFLQHSKQIESQWRNAIDCMQSVQAHPSGLLRIMAPGLFNRHLSGPFLSTFVQRYPEIDLQLTAHWGAPSVEKFEADLMFNLAPLEDKSFVSEPMTTSRHGFYASPGYLARAGVPSHPRELSRYALLTLRYPDLLTWCWQEADQLHHLNATSRLTFDDAEAALNMTVLGHGITSLPEFVCREQLKRGELVDLFDGCYHTNATLWAIYPRSPFESQRVRLFIDMVRDSELFGAPIQLPGRHTPIDS